jgi:hypothetical protein
MLVPSLRSKWAVSKAVRAGLALEDAYLNRSVTDEQRSRRSIFNATLRAAASWLFFGVACSLRINSDMLVVTASPARTALKNSQLTCGDGTIICETAH